MPANTFVATAEAVCAAGARPVFVDVLPDTLQIDPAAVAAAVTPATAAVMAVHLFGQMADVDALAAVAGRHGIALIEDAAQAHGARFAGRRAGSVGSRRASASIRARTSERSATAGRWSPPTRGSPRGCGGSPTTGGPPTTGTATTRAGATAASTRSRPRSCRPSCPGSTSTTPAGRRRWTATATALPDGCRPLAAHPAARPVHHLAVVEVDDRPRVMSALSASGIGWGIHYPVPCHRQPAFAHLAASPCRSRSGRRSAILSLPMWPSITDAEVSSVCDALWEAVG